jgi:hypothetical protein
MSFSTHLQKQVILASFLTGKYDLNRSMMWQEDDYSVIKEWAESIKSLDLQGVLYHNHFSEATCEEYQNENLLFIRVDYQAKFNPNIYRYYLYKEFVKEHKTKLESLFVTDVTDVVVIKNPFTEPLFLENPIILFCGDEPKKLDNEWMKAHSNHLRSQITNYETYEENFKDEILLNCGIIGGNIKVMEDLFIQLWQIHKTYNQHNQTAYTGDMGAFNYLARTQFNHQLKHGSPINTEFKAYQEQRTDCWFRHK